MNEGHNEHERFLSRSGEVIWYVRLIEPDELKHMKEAALGAIGNELAGMEERNIADGIDIDLQDSHIVIYITQADGLAQDVMWLDADGFRYEHTYPAG